LVLAAHKQTLLLVLMGLTQYFLPLQQMAAAVVGYLILLQDNPGGQEAVRRNSPLHNCLGGLV
jgi:hypothetical protein